MLRDSFHENGPPHGGTRGEAPSRSRISLQAGEFDASNLPPATDAGNPSPLLAAALDYAARGWPVFPLHSTDGERCTCTDLECRPGGKHARNIAKHPRTDHGFKEATTDREQIRRWWRIWPDANVGVVTGELSGIVVLDIDPRNGGDAALLELVKRHGGWTTVTAETGGGGLHYLFRHPGQHVSGKTGIRPGIDVKADGGYIVAAPSLHASGQSYAWVDGRGPDDLELAEMPAWLLEATARPKRRTAVAAVDLPADERLRRARAWLAKRAPAIEGEGGDHHTFATAASLRDFGLSEDETFALLLDKWNPTCIPPWEPGELRAKVANAYRYATGIPGAKLADRQPPIHAPRPPSSDRAAVALEPEEQTEGDARPLIRIVGGELSSIATEAEAALLAAGLDVFARGGTLVHPIVEEVDAAHGKRTNVARFGQIGLPYMRDLLCRAARFEKYNGTKKRWVPTNPPAEVAATILAREGEWSFPSVTGVITTPTLRPDGSILDRPGYDPATRLILMSPPPMPPIPDRPTKADAERALALIADLFEEFPFVDEASRSVALSGVITPIVRGAFPVAPAHASRSSTPGTGKSYLWDTSAAVCLGQPCPVMAAGRTEEETEKRLGAALIAGQQLISIDNVNGELGGDALCQLIERPLVDVRILGKSERVRVESRATILATGNNLTLLGDMTRRVLLCSLDAGMERPELRQFRKNPVEEVLADRGRYVAAALTVVRAYVVAGRPDPAPRLASFEGWSDTVRSALMWLGCADPVETMETARAEDPILRALRSVVTTWPAAVGTGRSKAVTAAEILRIADTTDASGAHLHPDFREAVLEVGSLRGQPNTRTLGRWLARHRGRIIDGLRLDGEGDSHGHARRWWVAPVDAAA